jgi:hypothetical protein
MSRNPVDFLVEFCSKKKKTQHDSASIYFIVLKAFSDVEEKQKYTEGHNPICDLLTESPSKHPTGFLTPWEDRSNFLCEHCRFLLRKTVKLSYLVEGCCSLDGTHAFCSNIKSIRGIGIRLGIVLLSSSF